MRRAMTSGRQAIGSCALLQRDPFVDQRAGIGARDGGIGGAQMAQPAEAEQRDGPFLGRRRHLERRARVADHDLAGETRSGRHRSRWRGSASAVRRSCGAITSRSALPKENGHWAMGCVSTRVTSRRRPPRARKTDSLVRSATETRDIGARFPVWWQSRPASVRLDVPTRIAASLRSERQIHHTSIMRCGVPWFRRLQTRVLQWDTSLDPEHEPAR